MPGESRYTRDLMRDLVDDGAVVIVKHSSAFSSGWPDRIVYHRLWHGMIELKAARGKLGPRQRENLARLEARRPGYTAVVREPGVLEDLDGNEIARFETGKQLMEILHDTARRHEERAAEETPSRCLK